MLLEHLVVSLSFIAQVSEHSPTFRELISDNLNCKQELLPISLMMMMINNNNEKEKTKSANNFSNEVTDPNELGRLVKEFPLIEPKKEKEKEKGNKTKLDHVPIIHHNTE